MSDLKERIFEFISRNGSTSFAELVRIEGFQGDLDIQMDTKLGPAVLWVGVSQEAHDALSDLLQTKKIESTPTTPLTYMCDGQLLDLPLFKNRKAKKPRWLPLVFNKAIC